MTQLIKIVDALTTNGFHTTPPEANSGLYQSSACAPASSVTNSPKATWHNPVSKSTCPVIPVPVISPEKSELP